MKVSIKELSMTRDIIAQIINIDKEFYTEFDYNDTSWYYKRYNNKNKITVLEYNDEIVGYYLFYNISDKLFKEICQLKYSTDYDFDEREINVDSKIEYMASILVKKEFRLYSYLLLRQLQKDIQKKSNKVVAIAISQVGHKMCDRYMKKIGNVSQTISIYVKE